MASTRTETYATGANVDGRQYHFVPHHPGSRPAPLWQPGPCQRHRRAFYRGVRRADYRPLPPAKHGDRTGRSADHPQEAFRFDLCGTVERSVGENPFGVINGEIPGGRCAVVRHHGSLDTTANSVWYLYRDWLPASGETLRDFPVYFRYHNFVHGG